MGRLSGTVWFRRLMVSSWMAVVPGGTGSRVKVIRWWVFRISFCRVGGSCLKLSEVGWRIGVSEFVVQMYTALIATFERDNFFGVSGRDLLGAAKGKLCIFVFPSHRVNDVGTHQGNTVWFTMTDGAHLWLHVKPLNAAIRQVPMPHCHGGRHGRRICWNNTKH